MMTMKCPKYSADTPQKQLDAGINTFAAQLLAESHADKPELWGDETVLIVQRAHSGASVYMLLTTQPPDADQFKDWPK